MKLIVILLHETLVRVILLNIYNKSLIGSENWCLPFIEPKTMLKTFIFYFRTRNDLAELVARLEKEINGGITKDLTDIHSSTCKLYTVKKRETNQYIPLNGEKRHLYYSLLVMYLYSSLSVLSLH